MKIDFQMVRDIILDVEASKESDYDDVPPTANKNVDEVLYHCRLLEEGGYLKLKWYEEEAMLDFFLIERLTWRGHELAALLKNESHLDDLLEKAKEESISLSVNQVEKILSHRIFFKMGLFQTNRK